MEVTSQKCDLFLVGRSEGGGGWERGGGAGGANWFDENYTIVDVDARKKEHPQKAYRFKGTLMVEGEPVVCRWGKLGMTSGVHNMCGIASVVPQTVPNQIWDVFAAKMNRCEK